LRFRTKNQETKADSDLTWLRKTFVSFVSFVSFVGVLATSKVAAAIEGGPPANPRFPLALNP
jgi:hypothetical protein